MVALWIVRDEQDTTGEIELSDGRVFNVNDIPGSSYSSENRRNNLIDAIHAEIETRIAEADVPDEEAFGMTDAEILAKWGGSMWIETQGQNRFLVSRSIVVSCEWIDPPGRLHFTISNI